MPRPKSKPKRLAILPLEIRALRIRMGISVESMATMFNYTSKDWQDFERNSNDPPRIRLSRVLRYMMRDLPLVDMQRQNPDWSL